MATKRELIAALYKARMQKGVCIHCEQPSSGYLRCGGCRADQAQYQAARRITTLTITIRRAQTST
jgi:hypothetical protein